MCSAAPTGCAGCSPTAAPEEESYFRKTANFPIMHTVLLRAELVEQNPWLASDMLTAFRTSKDAALAAIADPRKVALAWARDTYEAQRTLMGDDPWAYDAESSRHSLETVFRYAAEQLIVDKAPTVEGIFPTMARGDVPRYVRSS